MEQSLSLPNAGQVQSSTLNRIHEASAKFQRYKILLRRRWWFLLLTASIGVCVQALTITGKPQVFRSLAKLVAGGRMIGTESIRWEEALQDFYGTIIETIESAEMIRKARERVHSLHPDLKDSEVEIVVRQTKGSAIFNIRATGSEPKYTQIFLNALLDEFIAFRQIIREQAQGKVLNTFLQEVVSKQKAMEEKNDLYSKFCAANNLVTITNGNNEAASFLSSLKAQRETLRTSLAEIEASMADVRVLMQERERAANSGAASNQAGGQSKPADGNSQATSDNSTPNNGLTHAEQDYLHTNGQLTVLRTQKRSLMESFKENHPQVVDIAQEIAKLESLLKEFELQIQNEMRNQLASQKRKLEVFEKQIVEREKEALELGAKIAEHNRLKREADIAQEAYQEMFKRAETFQSMFNIQSDYVAIQERATPAAEHTDDWKMPIIIGLVVGLGAGVIILLLFDRLDDRMNSFSEFQALFPGEAVLGQIPEQRQRGDVALLRPNDDRHLYAEAFRNIRSSILFKNWSGKPPKTILCTSAVPNEGKTTVTSNLAVTMALAGARVLLADCDLRRGGVSELFKLPSTPGLSEALRGKLHWRDAVQETSTRNLDLLARGDVFDQTSEMLLSKTAEEMLKEMAEEYDYVIFDSAPVLVADDTASFAPKLDTVLFVVRMSSTMARLTGKALDLLYERQVNVGGVILNRSSSNLKEYTYYNYASYYYAPVKTSPQPAAVTAPAAKS